jgi:hypothetical protein
MSILEWALYPLGGEHGISRVEQQLKSSPIPDRE